jgi:hypothetical protein
LAWRHHTNSILQVPFFLNSLLCHLAIVGSVSNGNHAEECSVKRIVFDIETEPFTKAFQEAESIRARTKLAPQMRLACTFDESRAVYRYFGPREGRSLIKQLQSADEVISFNGNHFDILVLRRHYGLKGRVPHKGRHTDLCEIMSAGAEFRVSLDVAARLNLGEKKHTDGRKMNALRLDEIKLACQSDVCQTYRLFQRYISGTLQVPTKSWGRWDGQAEKSYSDAPRECPSCNAHDCLEEIDGETDEMSDGQLSDYLAGLYGSAECRKCGDVIDWGF